MSSERSLADLYRKEISGRGWTAATAAAELTREILAGEIVLPPSLRSSFRRLAPLSNDVLVIETKDGPIDADSVNAVYWNELPSDDEIVPAPDAAEVSPPPTPGPVPPKPRANKRGRREYDIWNPMFAHLDKLVKERGKPFETYSEAAGYGRDFVEQQLTEERRKEGQGTVVPTEGTIREKISDMRPDLVCG